MKINQNFHICLWSGPPPPYGQPDRKISVFFYASPKFQMGTSQPGKCGVMQKLAALKGSLLLIIGNFLSGKNMFLVFCLMLFFISAMVFLILWIFEVLPIHYPSPDSLCCICVTSEDSHTALQSVVNQLASPFLRDSIGLPSYKEAIEL